jgi:hypothetical protein
MAVKKFCMLTNQRFINMYTKGHQWTPSVPAVSLYSFSFPEIVLTNHSMSECNCRRVPVYMSSLNNNLRCLSCLEVVFSIYKVRICHISYHVTFRRPLHVTDYCIISHAAYCNHWPNHTSYFLVINKIFFFSEGSKPVLVPPQHLIQWVVAEAWSWSKLLLVLRLRMLEAIPLLPLVPSWHDV